VTRARVPARRASELPSALGVSAFLRSSARPPFLFFDFDGTLAWIAARPDLAELRPDVRAVVIRLSERWPLAIVSGRDLDDLLDLVGVPGLVYAGCHGLEITGPGGWREDRGTGAAGALDRAERSIREATAAIPGVVIERKRLGLAVHHRQVRPERIGEVERIVAGVAAAHPELRRGSGKAVLELRPNVAWTKGDAVRRILEVFDPSGSRTPVYLGDDATDEDAFVVVSAIAGGVAVAVGLGADETGATHRLDGPDEVLAFMRSLADP
jgi:trehalose 6-phosphate phosphatase